MDSAMAGKSLGQDVHDVQQWEEIRAGSLSVRLAAKREEIQAAQALRYRIFYEEMGGVPSAQVKAQKRDFDEFDDYCDHMIVLDSDLPRTGGQVVGTYRLLRQSAMKNLGHFYTESEFDIGAIKQEKGEKLELGRSCVDTRYRSRAVLQLLWRGIASYIAQYDIKLMFGCASFIGTDVESHALALSYLHHYHSAPPALRLVALPERYIDMNLIAKNEIDTHKAFALLPPLIKGYLRVNGFIGDGAIIDRHCNTIDVGISLQNASITDKYAQRYATSPLQSET